MKIEDIETTMRLAHFRNKNTKKSKDKIQLQWICYSVNFKLYEI